MWRQFSCHWSCSLCSCVRIRPLWNAAPENGDPARWECSLTRPCLYTFQTPDLSHSVVSTSTFRAEYRRGGGSSMFSRNVRFQVDISAAPGERDPASATTFCLTFTLVSGNGATSQVMMPPSVSPLPSSQVMMPPVSPSPWSRVMVPPSVSPLPSSQVMMPPVSPSPWFQVMMPPSVSPLPLSQIMIPPPR